MLKHEDLANLQGPGPGREACMGTCSLSLNVGKGWGGQQASQCLHMPKGLHRERCATCAPVPSRPRRPRQTHRGRGRARAANSNSPSCHANMVRCNPANTKASRHKGKGSHAKRERCRPPFHFPQALGQQDNRPPTTPPPTELTHPGLLNQFQPRQYHRRKGVQGGTQQRKGEEREVETID